MYLIIMTTTYSGMEHWMHATSTFDDAYSHIYEFLCEFYPDVFDAAEEKWNQSYPTNVVELENFMKSDTYIGDNLSIQYDVVPNGDQFAKLWFRYKDGDIFVTITHHDELVLVQEESE